MTRLLDLLSTHGVSFALGTTTILAIGAVAARLTRSPARVQRIGELAVLLALAWPFVALLPIERHPWPSTVAPASVEPVDQVIAPSNPGVVGTTSTAAPGRVADAGPGSSSVEVAPWTPRPWTWSPLPRVLALAFVIVVGLRSLWLLVGMLSLVRLLRRASPAPAEVVNLARRLDPDAARVAIQVSSDSTRPFCAPAPRPVIVLPRGVVDANDNELLSSVLLHELAHVRRRDLVTEALFALASPLLGWTPLFAWLHRRVRQCAELLADDLATRQIDKLAYVHALVRLAERAHAPRTTPVAALSAIELANDFHRRMKMLLRRETTLETRPGRAHLFARTTLAGALLVATSLALGAPAVSAGLEPEVRSSGTQEAAEESAASRYRMRFEFPDEGALGRFLMRFATGGRTVSVTALSPPSTAGQSWSGEFTVESASPEFLRELMAIAADDVQVTSAKRYADRPARPRNEAKVSLEEKDADVRDLIDQLARSARANIVVSPEVRGSVTVRLEDTSFRDALDAITAGLGFVVLEQGGGVLLVTTP